MVSTEDPLRSTSVDLANTPQTVHPSGKMNDFDVVNMVNKVEDCIADHYRVIVGRMVTKIRKERDNRSKMHVCEDEPRTIVATSSANISIKRPSASPRLEDIQRNICLLPALFNKRFRLKVLSINLIEYLPTMIDGDEPYHHLQPRVSFMLPILYFNKKSNEKSKGKFATAIGRPVFEVPSMLPHPRVFCYARHLFSYVHRLRQTRRHLKLWT